MGMKFLWVFDADAIWVLAPAIGTLWALGGSGPKWVRRFLAPLLIGVSAVSVGIGIIPSALTTVLLSLSASLGYGQEKHRELNYFYWPFLFLIGGLYGASLAPIGVASGDISAILGCVVFCSLVFGGLTTASQRLDFPKWKWVEISIGFAVGLSAAFLIHKTYSPY
jgi:hypothetical protein